MSASGSAPSRQSALEPASALVRAVVDTNVWISGLLSAARADSPTQRLIHALVAREFVAVVSRVLLDELTRVASRPYFPKRATTWTADAMALVARLDRGAMIVPIAGVSYGCRDPKDDAVIETAIRGRAQYLVTGDRDLLDANVATTLNAHGILLITARGIIAAIEAR